MTTPVFVYDGDCAFCSACARFIGRRVSTPAVVVPWQFSDLAALGLTGEQAEQAVQWVPRDAEGRPVPGATAAGPDAIARLLRSARGPLGRALWRPLGAVLALRPVSALAWPVYRWVARNRHRLPGGTAACSLSQAERERMRALS